MRTLFSDRTDAHSLIRRGRQDIPSPWPANLGPRVLKGLGRDTPFLATDLNTIRDRYTRLLQAMPGVQPFYAMKCNPSPEVISALAAQGSSFEVASFPELQTLIGLGIDPARVLYSNTVKPPAHIEAAHAAGLWRFAADSGGEIQKLATLAPGAAVYIRLRVDDSSASFPLSRKFGAEAAKALILMREAQRVGLQPYGLTFHVGSQCVNPLAWAAAIGVTGDLMTDLAAEGIQIEMLDIGGGFPADYGDGVPSIGDIGRMVTSSIDELLPYRPTLIAAEPGRHLVAEAGVMVATVLGRDVRAGENWLYLDVGAYNGLMESLQTNNAWKFPIWSSRPDHGVVPRLPFTVTGPSCDSSDTMFYGEMLPSTIEAGNQLYIGGAGAYSLSYASSFNGFGPPATVFVG
ncbi:type III PLP-dependent enzyme [Euzebya tangerina]|uniref:type III PLP-dependent enzyme n=1 Tax=Euzebya tangerina TaxID=591198 RepID=UPI000E30F4ED|nr:type III PLP-dependent enzyme [Euzebya tangerina]